MKIVVIGSGIAGLHTSLKAAKLGHRVTIITKKKVIESATNYAQGGIAAVLSQADNFKKHIEDTLKAGAYHNRKKAVSMMVREAKRLIHELIEIGVPFATLHGKLLLAKEGGHTERRIAFVGDYTGQEIEKALVSRVKREKNITVLENRFAVDLLVKNNVCYGVQAFNGKRLQNIFADRIILATGGLGQIYRYTTNPEISTGDGYAMAFRAGAKFRDMEFIQFHPTAFEMKDGRLFLLTEALRGEGAFLRNAKGERFMKKIHKMAELAPRDIVSRAIFADRKVYLDLRHLDEQTVHSRFPKITQILKENGYDISKDLIPIFPAAHYCCGGIETDLRGRVKTKTGFCRYLYAFGEVAWTGVHGANRLASNSLLEALVFSDQIVKGLSGKRIQLSAKLKRCFRIPKVLERRQIPEREIGFLKTFLRNTLWHKVGIVRRKKELEEAKEILENLRLIIDLFAKKGFHPKIHELLNMTEAGILVTDAALKRKQSLGCHYVP